MFYRTPINLILIKAAKKQGKSSLGAILMSAAMSKGKAIAGVEAIEQDLKVLWIDLEMPPATLAQRAVGLYRMSAGLNSEEQIAAENEFEAEQEPERKGVLFRSICDETKAAAEKAALTGEKLRILSLIQESTENRTEIVKRAISDLQPDICVIDTIAELSKDTNDAESSKAKVEDLLRAATLYACTVIGVIHENKNDTNARGFLGDYYEAKSCEVYHLEKCDSSTVRITQALSRFQPIKDFTFRFRNGMRFEAADASEAETERKNKLIENFRTLFQRCAKWTHKELTIAYADLHAISVRQAERDTEEAARLDVLDKKKKGRNTEYTFCFDIQNVSVIDETDEDFI